MLRKFMEIPENPAYYRITNLEMDKFTLLGIII